eukprot:1598828-Amphidinium_carterae.1
MIVDPVWPSKSTCDQWFVHRFRLVTRLTLEAHGAFSRSLVVESKACVYKSLPIQTAFPKLIPQASL